MVIFCEFQREFLGYKRMYNFSSIVSCVVATVVTIPM